LAQLALGQAAQAAPPASCASKFVGVWTYPGGTTTIHPNGTATPSCVGCVAVQSWTCNGNTYLFSNSGSPGEFSAVLVDATHLVGSGVTAVRVGGGHPSASPDTGAGGDSAADKEAKRLLIAARAAEQYCTYLDQMKAAENYQHAAEEFASAGDEGRAQQARQASERASANADRCEKKKALRQAAKSPSASAKHRSACTEALSYILKLKMAGNDTTPAEEAARAKGCQL
jgi:hypothetical protein